MAVQVADNSLDSFSLLAVSPLDGRYARETRALQEYFSEFALVRGRVRVEIAYLLALAQETGLVRPLAAEEESRLRALAANFSPADAAQIKEIERTTRHDVKAVEYFLRRALADSPLADVIEWLHFGLTSEDVNLIAQAAALREARQAALLPALDAILVRLSALARQYRSVPLLARTHGQAAVPTTLGKELAVFLRRLQKQRAVLAQHVFEAKLAGAVGNFNALVAAAPQVDWIAFSERFVRSYELQPNLAATQLIPYDNWVAFFDALRLANTLLIDFAQDMWRYISDDILKSRVVAGEVGSSTMPQKVNPIDFENAEGNLGIANALLEFFARKLPVSRLQRDLSDSTVRRTFGVALGHSIVAWDSIGRGLDKIEPDAEAMRAELEAHWEIVAEGAQTILRAAGIPDAYEQLKNLTRGKVMNRSAYLVWVDTLLLPDTIREQLRALSPTSYIGLAEQLARKALAE